MKNELISLIKILGLGLTELVIDIDLDYITINSIEYREPDEVWIHHFDNNDMDYEIEFDEIPNKYQRRIFNKIKSLLYN
jgi:hypothetical protein